MKRFLSLVANVGGFSFVTAIVSVLLVVAVTSAQQNDSDPAQSDSVSVTSDSVVSDNSDSDAGANPGSAEERLDMIEFRLDVLDELATGLTDRQDEQDSTVEKISSLVDALKVDLQGTRSEVEGLTDTLSGLNAKIAALRTAVDDLGARTAKLGADGTYTGPVEPPQLTRKLTPGEVSGQWPLDRTTGTLDIDKLGTPTFGCFGDSRYNVFMSVDVFGRYVCVKVLK